MLRISADQPMTRRQSEPSFETVWTVRRGDQLVRAELYRSDGSWDVRLFSDRQLFAALMLGSRGLALVWADSIFDGVVAEGWMPGSQSIHSSWGEPKNV